MFQRPVRHWKADCKGYRWKADSITYEYYRSSYDYRQSSIPLRTMGSADNAVGGTIQRPLPLLPSPRTVPRRPCHGRRLGFDRLFRRQGNTAKRSGTSRMSGRIGRIEVDTGRLVVVHTGRTSCLDGGAGIIPRVVSDYAGPVQPHTLNPHGLRLTMFGTETCCSLVITGMEFLPITQIIYS